MTDQELLAFHRELVAIRSLSGEEGEVCGFLEEKLRSLGLAEVERTGNNLFVFLGSSGPVRLCLNSHVDTVPAGPGWTRPPHQSEVIDGRVHGLGSNDAKASVASMIAALLRTKGAGDHIEGRILLALTAEEETGGRGGVELLLGELTRRELLPQAVVVGEPTGLDLALSQKGLLILELVEKGRSCHAAHARKLGAGNVLRELSRDILALEAVDLGPEDPILGPLTLEPTTVCSGTARNMVPAEARCTIDVRTNPKPTSEELLERLRWVIRGELRVLSDRLRPCTIDPDHPLVHAAQRARPQARCFGSRGVSDLVFFQAAGIPGIKVGPGKSERSHTPDEYVLESEVLEGARFFEQLVKQVLKEADP